MSNIVGHLKTIKSVKKKRFEVMLLEAPSGHYYVSHSTKMASGSSEAFRDFDIASKYFDYKIQELEGQ